MSGLTLIRGGHVYDGKGGPGQRADVLLSARTVAEVAPRIAPPPDAKIVDADGCWVTPGFIDNHTHYDAEVEIAPALAESVRHGITTVTIGSCGLGMAVGEPGDLADMFCRVEGVPRSGVKPLLEQVKDWSSPREYLDHLDGLPLGPNVAALLGHSGLRASVLGLGRSLDPRARVSEAEMGTMTQLLEEALEAGFVGLSVNTLRWDKMDGDAFRSQPTPSTFAPWSEYRRLNRVLRQRGRVWQGVPNVSTKINVLLFLLESVGIFRPALKTAVISLIDARANRATAPLAGFVSWFFNRFFDANFRFQSLPVPFDFWVDGLEVPIFEEIGAGTELLHLKDPDARTALLRDPAHRARFRQQWAHPFAGRAYHRDLSEARVVSAPDEKLEGKTFAEIAKARGLHPVDTLLDLVAEHGSALRWYTVLGNDRPGWLRWIVDHPSVQVGFSDAGAHLRNMAHYNFPLRLLRMVKSEDDATIGRAVHRVTGEITNWLNLPGGELVAGAPADVVVIDPEGLDTQLEALHEAEMPGFPGLSRLVRRNDDAVRAVWVGGQLAVESGRPVAALGRHRGFGRVARAC